VAAASENGERPPPASLKSIVVLLEPDACYRALVARDARFDGLFFVGVTTTGIYCRPVCRARTPARSRCLFFRRAAEAEREGYRACFRCRPEQAPGGSSMEALPRLVARAVARIESGALDEMSVDDLARELSVTSRHLRRAVQKELGVTPVALAQSARLALAKQLVQDSRVSLSEVAFASGFASLRRFNALFRERLGRSPSELRGVRAADDEAGSALPLTLGYRPPLAWDALIAFLAARATRGVEAVENGAYLRTVRVGSRTGWLVARDLADRCAVRVEVSPSLGGALVPLAARLRRLFDLDAQPSEVDAHLARDAGLRPLVRRTPGLRLPGAVDGFELAARAVLGQQVSVPAATTLAGRLAALVGEPIATTHPALVRLAPTAARVAEASERDLAGVGLTGARARTLRVLAEEVASGRLDLDAPADARAAVEALQRVPGIGAWTASYIAMRAFGAPDAFPSGDRALCRALRVPAGALDARAADWSPWRAYAALHIWNGESP
jgi:AraC family transcriptional regulator of adaptative response / DNA-3-methyladenine glycosylase II